MVKELGLVSSLRGHDSTGLLIGFQPMVGGKDYLHIVKSLQEAGPFLYSKETSKALDNAKPFFIAGHCRAATIGQVNIETAHPYRYQHIQGMHNGTVPAMDPGKEFEDTHTDSRMIIESLATDGLKKTIEAMGYGAYALIWADNREKTLNFYRNDKRTLYNMKTTDGTMYWASETSFLKFIKERCWYSDSCFKAIEPFESGVHYKFPFKSLHAEETKIPFPEEPRTAAIGWSGRRMGPPYYGAYGGGEDWTEYLSSENDPPWKNDNREYLDRAAYDAAQAGLREILSRPLAPPSENEYVYKGFNGKKLTKDETEALLHEGCCGCGTQCDWEEDDEVFWLDDTTYLCEECFDADWYEAYRSGKHYTLGEKIDDKS